MKTDPVVPVGDVVVDTYVLVAFFSNLSCSVVDTGKGISGGEFPTQTCPVVGWSGFLSAWAGCPGKPDGFEPRRGGRGVIGIMGKHL
jgi:hypothetical protein